MEDGVHVALVLLNLLFQVGQAPVAVMGHGDGAGDFALHIHLQCLGWPAPVCKQPPKLVSSRIDHSETVPYSCVKHLLGRTHLQSR